VFGYCNRGGPAFSIMAVGKRITGDGSGGVVVDPFDLLTSSCVFLFFCCFFSFLFFSPSPPLLHPCKKSFHPAMQERCLLIEEEDTQMLATAHTVRILFVSFVSFVNPRGGSVLTLMFLVSFLLYFSFSPLFRHAPVPRCAWEKLCVVWL